jgi:hypothetical protein
MPLVDFSQEDILRGTLVEPGWYKLRIGEFSEELTKSGDSTNYIFKDCVILKNADTGDEKFAGVPVRIQFSAKPTARGFLKGFFSSLGMEVVAGARFDISACAGREIEAMVENNLYEGNWSNRINHKYRAPRS